MDIKDKLTLLFLAGTRATLESQELVFPTFATSVISKRTFEYLAQKHPLNFDLDNKSTIILNQHVRDSHLYYFLQLTPKKYSTQYQIDDGMNIDRHAQILGDYFQLEPSLFTDFVRIGYFDQSIQELFGSWRIRDCCELYLIGDSVENKWAIYTPDSTSFYGKEWDHHENDDNGIVFNIY
ncbi:hypothetical protein BCR42DRAFT_428931, partial [Absidia repens]